MKVKISSITIGDNRRSVDYDKVQMLADSIKEVGLLSPVVISQDNVLVAGRHRLEAFKLLGRDEPEIIDFLAAAKRGKVGRPPKVKGQTDAKGNVSDSDGLKRIDDGVEYAYNRLRNDAPELHKKVLSGEISAHAAMVKAGFRNKRRAVNMDNAESALGTLTSHMSHETLDELIDLLIEWRNTNG